jgi:hypothetical protein
VGGQRPLRRHILAIRGSEGGLTPLPHSRFPLLCGLVGKDHHLLCSSSILDYPLSSSSERTDSVSSFQESTNFWMPSSSMVLNTSSRSTPASATAFMT